MQKKTSPKRERVLLSMNVDPPFLSKLDKWRGANIPAGRAMYNRTETVKLAMEHFYRTYRG